MPASWPKLCAATGASKTNCTWVLDVQRGEDDSRVRTGHAAENLATLRKLVLNLLRRDTQTKVGTCAKQLKAAWDHAYLQSLLTL